MQLTNMEIIKAQGDLAKLMEIDLPIKVSLDIALISNMVDKQVKAYNLVRDKFLKAYSIKTRQGERENSVIFESTIKGETEEETSKLQEENLKAFSQKFNELLDTKTEDLVFQKIQLPSEVDGKSLQIKPEILKTLMDFIEIK